LIGVTRRVAKGELAMNGDKAQPHALTIRPLSHTSKGLPVTNMTMEAVIALDNKAACIRAMDSGVTGP
jgi:hypothetical protein